MTDVILSGNNPAEVRSLTSLEPVGRVRTHCTGRRLAAPRGVDPAWLDVQEQFVDSWLAPKTPVALESLTRALSGSWALWVPQEVQSTSLKLTRKRASWDLLAGTFAQ